jgi:hypothetical protein
MRVVKAPPIQFKCTSCRATNEGDASEFKEQHTMPPSFLATCAFCGFTNTCFPSALIARAATRDANLLVTKMRQDTEDAIEKVSLGIVEDIMES